MKPERRLADALRRLPAPEVPEWLRPKIKRNKGRVAVADLNLGDDVVGYGIITEKVAKPEGYFYLKFDSNHFGVYPGTYTLWTQEVVPE